MSTSEQLVVTLEQMKPHGEFAEAFRGYEALTNAAFTESSIAPVTEDVHELLRGTETKLELYGEDETVRPTSISVYAPSSAALEMVGQSMRFPKASILQLASIEIVKPLSTYGVTARRVQLLGYALKDKSGFMFRAFNAQTQKQVQGDEVTRLEYSEEATSQIEIATMSDLRQRLRYIPSAISAAIEQNAR